MTAKTFKLHNIKHNEKYGDVITIFPIITLFLQFGSEPHRDDTERHGGRNTKFETGSGNAFDEKRDNFSNEFGSRPPANKFGSGGGAFGEKKENFSGGFGGSSFGGKSDNFYGGFGNTRQSGNRFGDESDRNQFTGGASSRGGFGGRGGAGRRDFQDDNNEGNFNNKESMVFVPGGNGMVSHFSIS